MITVIIKHPSQPPTTEQLDLGHDDGMQKFSEIVGGYFEMHHLFPDDPKVAFFCNEDGKRLGLAPNFRLAMFDDTIQGTVVIFRRQDPDTASLTDAQQKRIMEFFGG